MRYVDSSTEALQFPEESLSGDAGVGVGLLDTGWDIIWPGPGHVYLSDRDIVDILVAAKDAELVVDALQKNGWTAPGDTDARVAELEAQKAELAEALAAAKIAEAGFDAALGKLEAAKPKAATAHKPKAATAHKPKAATAHKPKAATAHKPKAATAHKPKAKE